jgi:predicted nucleic acid-binding protein
MAASARNPRTRAALIVVTDAGPLIDLASAGRIDLLPQLYARVAVPRIGTLGVLLLAKEAGHVAEVAPILDRLVAQGMYVSAALRARVLRSANELAGDVPAAGTPAAGSA